MVYIRVRGTDTPAIVDDEDAERCRRAWFVKNGYPTTRIYAGKRNGRSFYRDVTMHRFVLSLPRGGDGSEVDHLSRDTFDNRRANLRLGTRVENAQNQDAHRRWGSRPSRFRGVHWDRAANKWKVGHRIGGRFISLGYFTDEAVAGRVASDWRREHMAFATD